jgi:RNA polymerase sigma-70 factor, ECF subfamily
MDEHAIAQQLDRLEEALWVAQAQAGDTEAFGRLMQRYERPLLYYLGRLAPKGDSAIDLHQEVWLDVFRGLPSLQVPEAFRVWLYRIAHHKAARFIRDEIRLEQASVVLDQADATRFEEWDAEAVHKGLAELPPHLREILTLHYLNDLSTAEVGRILDCPPGTVKSRLHHARAALRAAIERKKL